MKILQLKSSNVKRLRTVEIEPDGNLVVIGGRNGAGKSTCLDSILYALGGARAVPAEPIRRGAERGEIEVRLSPCPEKKIHDELIVKRVFTSSGDTRLEIRSAGGMTAGSPQALLDSLTGRVGFDPLAFMRLRPSEQAAQLAGVVGLDFTELERDRADIYQERHANNKQLVAARVEAEKAPHFPEAREVDTSELAEEYKRRQAINQSAGRLVGEAHDLARDAEYRQEKAAAADAEVEQLREALEQAMELARQAHAVATEAIEKAAAAKEAADAAAQADLSEIETQIAAAGETNRQVAANRRREELRAKVEELEQESKYLTEKLEEIDAQKARMMAEAAWPIPGLGFGPEGVTLAGLPFEQASSAEQLAVSVAVGAALNPACRVLLIRDGSLLDRDSLRMVGELAEKFDCQVWIERVSEGEECSVIIEDGMVAAEKEQVEGASHA